MLLHRPGTARRLTGSLTLLLAGSLLALLAARPARSERRFELDGRFSSTLGFRTGGEGGASLRDLLLDLEGSWEWGDGWKLRALGRARFEDRLEPEPFRELDLRELVLTRRAPAYTLKLGRQQVVWGKADGLRLLDVINPLDLREFLLDDYTDSRIPLWMVNAEVFHGDQAFQLLVIPDLAFDRLAAPGGEFFAFPTPPGLPVTVQPLDEPSGKPENWEYGLRWSTRAGRLDLTVNAFSGWNNTPGLLPRPSPAGLELTPRAFRSRLLGASGDLPLGPAVLRFEATLTDDDPRPIATSDGLGAFLRQRVWRHVLGLDWIRHGWLISPQWFEERVLGADPRLTGDTRQRFLTLLVRQTFRQDRLTLQVFSAYGFEHRDIWLSPRLTYRFFGRLELAVGADLLGGEPRGVFGRFDRRDRVTFETTVRF